MEYQSACTRLSEAVSQSLPTSEAYSHLWQLTMSPVPDKMKRYVLASRGDLSGIQLEHDAPVPSIKSPTQVSHACSDRAQD
jgi:hypothetical protein